MNQRTICWIGLASLCFSFAFTLARAEPELVPLPLPDGAPAELRDKGPPLLYADGVIRYKLSEEALVQIRIGRQGDAELVQRTVLDWEPRKAGENSERWDAKDYGSCPVDASKMVIRISLKPPSPAAAASAFTPYSPGAKRAGGKEETRLHEHAKHDPHKCKAIALRLVAPAANGTVSGRTDVSVDVDSACCGYGQTAGHGMRVYIDNEEVAEDYFPSCGTLTIPLDTKKFLNGTHHLTVNVCDHNDHVGGAAAMIEIKN